jgi:hypothetical protein
MVQHRSARSHRKKASQVAGGQPPSERYTFTNNGETAEVNFISSRRFTNEQELIDYLQLDTSIWYVKKFLVGTSEAYRKDRKVHWDVENNSVTRGHVRDSGKLLIEPLFSVKIWLERKTAEIRANLAVADLKQDARRFMPRYPRLKYPRRPEGLLYEVEMPDLQLGRLVLAEEAGEATDPDSTLRDAETAVADLLAHIREREVTRILFPIGNDFFDSDNAEGETAHGTPQRDDVRWQRTFSLAKRTVVRLIDRMAQIAPVDVLVVPGNHDRANVWYFGDTLESWYARCPNVTVDNRPISRKYYQFGKCLIGFSHGYDEKLELLAGLMPGEQPLKWADTWFHEYHLGHLHHKVDLELRTKELPNGVVVRRLRSLARPSVWEHDKGFVGTLKAVEGFLWHPRRGVIGQFTGFPEG